MTLIDTTELLLAFLKLQAGLAAEVTVGGVVQIYGPPGVPENWALSKAVTIIPDGNPSSEDLPMEYVGVQFRSYAPTEWEAMAVYRQLAACLLHRNAVAVPITGGSGLFQFARRTSGPHYGVEPQTLWPYVMSLWEVHLGQDLIA